MEERASDKNAFREQALSYPALGAMTGGFLGLLGIFLGWFVYEAQAAGGGVDSLVLRGTQDLSGQLAAHPVMRPRSPSVGGRTHTLIDGSQSEFRP